MADKDEGQGASSGTQEDRIARLEGKIDTLAAALAARTPTTHAQAEANTRRRLDAGSDIESRVSEEVQRIFRHREEDAERKASAAHREEMSRRVEALEKGRRTARTESESKPEQQVRGITAALWGRP